MYVAQSFGIQSLLMIKVHSLGHDSLPYAAALLFADQIYTARKINKT